MNFNHVLPFCRYIDGDPITTIASIVKKLETEEFVNHESFGRNHQYFPTIKKETYRQFSANHLVQNYFNRSSKQLISYLMQKEILKKTELQELLVETKQRKND